MTNNIKFKNGRITTACLLAAGTGSRLYPLTNSAPKCLTEVNGRPILEELLYCLQQNGFKRLVIVVGHFEQSIRRFLDEYEGDLTIDYIVNPIYKTTNNIYSLWLTKEIIQESFLLIESDIIFDASLLGDLLYPNKIAISHMLPWMNGTTVTLDSLRRVSAFGTSRNMRNVVYKTVNIYSLSWSSWQKIIVYLNRYIAFDNLNYYYEAVFRQMIADGSLDFDSVFFDAECWYEVDTLEDLSEAERISLKINRNFRISQPEYINSSLEPLTHISHLKRNYPDYSSAMKASNRAISEFPMKQTRESNG